MKRVTSDEKGRAQLEEKEERKKTHLIATEYDAVSIPVHEEHGYGWRRLAV